MESEADVYCSPRPGKMRVMFFTCWGTRDKVRAGDDAESGA